MRGSGGVPTSERLPFLEGIRGLLALYVVIGHLFTMADPAAFSGRLSSASEGMQAWGRFFGYGHLAVAGFILLSGYCLQIALYIGSGGRLVRVDRFYGRRARRILPAYYACLVISIAVALTITPQMPGMPFDVYLPVTPENVAAHFALVHNLRPDWMYKINGVLWSIAIEVQLYLLFPLIVALLHRFGRAGLLLGTFGASAAMLAWIPNAPKLYPWYLALFALGMAGASAVYRPSLRGQAPVWVAWAGFAISVAAMVWACVVNLEMPLRDLFAGSALISLIYALTRNPYGGLARALGWGPLYGLGSFSYSLYLMHHPIQQAWFLYRPEWTQTPEARLQYLAMGLPAIFIGSWLFAGLFERPFVKGRSETAQERPEEFSPVSLPLRAAELA